MFKLNEDNGIPLLSIRNNKAIDKNIIETTRIDCPSKLDEYSFKEVSDGSVQVRVNPCVFDDRHDVITTVTIRPSLVTGLTAFVESSSQLGGVNLMGALFALGKLQIDIDKINTNDGNYKSMIDTTVMKHIKCLKEKIMDKHPTLIDEFNDPF